MTNLIEFWRNAKFDGGQYVHPEDRKCKKLSLDDCFHMDPLFNGPSGYIEFIRSGIITSGEGPRLYPWVRPQPYMGDLRNAKIIFLLLNPSLSYTDAYCEQSGRFPDLTKQLDNNLHQRDFDEGFPFLWLNPEFCYHSGFVWWERKFRKVIVEVVKNRQIDYLAAIKKLSQRIACIDLVPYHSVSFNHKSAYSSLASVKAACDYVEKRLSNDSNQCKFVIPRGEGHWGKASGNLQKLFRIKRDRVVRYKSQNARAASFFANKHVRELLQKEILS
ncbi:MAG: hypothetical protein ACRER2_14955 [Methylococcales bacterium]